MEFVQIENLFYAALFIAGGVGSIARQCGDNDNSSVRVWFGRTLSGGLFGGGISAYWLAAYSNTGDNFSAWLYVFASSLIGFCSIDIKDKLLQTFILWLYAKFTGDKASDENDRNAL